MKLTPERLAELQAKNLPHATPAIWDCRVSESAPDPAQGEKHLATVAEYLKAFLPPSDCVCCGSKQGAKDIIDGLLGGAMFRWGIAHGEGECSKCGYPGRAMHYIGNPEILTVRNYILQYHPSALTPEQDPVPS